MLLRYRMAEFVSLMRSCSNHAGRVQLIETSEVHGSMVNVTMSMRQTVFKGTLGTVPMWILDSVLCDMRVHGLCSKSLLSPLPVSRDLFALLASTYCV